MSAHEIRIICPVSNLLLWHFDVFGGLHTVGLLGVAHTHFDAKQLPGITQSPLPASNR
jgi:hypothetical protein